MSTHWVSVLAVCVILLAGACSGDSSNAKDLGATGKGRQDDSAAIQKALDECAENGGGTVELPAGRYRLDHPITVPSGVTLAGEWEAPHHAQLMKGTVILGCAGKGKEDGPPLVSLSPSSGVKGLTFFYPQQRIPGTQPYPWTIQGSGMHGSVIDVTLVNACRFGRDLNQVVLGPEVKAAVITGNTMRGAFKIENQSKGDVNVSGNVTRAKPADR